MTDKPQSDVSSRVMGGALLNVGGMVLIRILSLLNIVILVRLLTPSDFGILALVMVVIGFVEALTNNQFDRALVRQKDIKDSHFGTALSMALIFGIGSGAAIFMLADLLAAFFRSPELADPLRLMALAPILAGLRNPNFVRREKALEFWPKVTMHVTSRLSLSIVAIGMAVLLGSYWALIFGTLTGFAVHTAMTYILSNHGLPRPNLVHWRAFLSFGGWLTGAGALEFLNRRLPAAVVGRFVSVFDAGVYQVGAEIATTMTQQLLAPINNAIFPGLMAISSEKERMRKGYLLVQECLLGIALPLGFGLSLVANELVRVLLGAPWHDAASIIQLLTPVTALGAVIFGVQAVVLIDGGTRGLFLRNLTVLMVLLSMGAVASMTWGIKGLIYAHALALLVNVLLTLGLAVRPTGTGLLAPFFAARRSFVAVAAMALVLSAVDAYVGLDTKRGPFDIALQVLLVKIVLAVPVYLLFQLGQWRLAGRPDGFESHILKLIAFRLRRIRVSG